MQRIYLDHNATTPVHPAVLEAMIPYFTAEFGNPSSAHRFGQRGRQAVEGARECVAALVGAQSDEMLDERRDERSQSSWHANTAIGRPLPQFPQPCLQHKGLKIG